MSVKFFGNTGLGQLITLIKNKFDSLATVARTGSYNDLSDKPTIPSAGNVSGVKGSAEVAYRTGDVSLSPANIGAVNKAGDTMTGTLNISGPAGIVIGADLTSLAAGGFAHGYTDSGDYSQATGKKSFASGFAVVASNFAAHAEGTKTIASGQYSHAEGRNTVASYFASHAEGEQTGATGRGAHAEGRNTQATSDGSHAEGHESSAFGEASHAEGMSTAYGTYAHAEGHGSIARYYASHAEGSSSTEGEYAHAEGGSHVRADYGHGEGHATYVMSIASHSEGMYTRAGTTGGGEEGAHAEGYWTMAIGKGAHAEGYMASDGSNTPQGVDTINNSIKKVIASGNGAHAEGIGTQALYDGQHVEGKFNVPGNYAHIIGGGSSVNSRANILTVDWSGNVKLYGSCTFANGTWNVVGDDCAIGDINIAGTLGVKGQNGTTRIRLCQYNGSNYGDAYFDGSRLRFQVNGGDATPSVDSNGYIYAVHYNMSVAVQNDQLTTNSYLIFSDSEGWFRKATVARVKEVMALNNIEMTSLVSIRAGSNVEPRFAEEWATFRDTKLPDWDSDIEPSAMNKGISISQGIAETSGIQFNGDYIVMWSPCDSTSLLYYDEDNGSIVWGISDGAYFSGTAARANAVSDRRKKKDIEYIDGDKIADVIKFIDSLKPVTFKYIKQDRFEEKTTYEGTERTHHGLIAQDVEEAIDNSNLEDHGSLTKEEKIKILKTTDDDGKVISKEKIPTGDFDYYLDYSEYVSDLIVYCQYLSKRVNELEERISKMEKENS